MKMTQIGKFLTLLLILIVFSAAGASAQTVEKPKHVYVTKKGKKFHTKNCKHIQSKTTTKITFAAAKKKKFKACKACKIKKKKVKRTKEY